MRDTLRQSTGGLLFHQLGAFYTGIGRRCKEEVESFCKKIRDLDKRQEIMRAKELTARLDQIEEDPLLFCDHHSTHSSQQVQFQAYLIAGRTILSAIQDCSLEEAKKVSLQLKRRLVALQYRLEKVHGGLDPLLESTINEQLERVATHWKSLQSIYYDKSLTHKDLQRLQKACQYPEFVKLLLQDEQLQDEFMKWVLRDKICAGPFIEYPALQTKIIQCGLNGRIGRLGGDMLKIQKVRVADHSLQKMVTLPFEGKEINILDERAEVIFKGNYKLTIKEVFEVFRSKQHVAGNLEFFIEGITNWNVNCLGWWNADECAYQMVDLTKTQWWKQLPLIEILSKEEAQMRYGYHLDGICWDIAAVATRSSPTLDLYNNHAYVEVVIPTEDGRYAVYDFGKAATEFPINSFERVTRVCENFLATVCYPDDNFFYTHRQHACHSFPVTPDQGVKFMEDIKRDLLKAREGNMVYQIESENCAEWVQHKLENLFGSARVPNLFRVAYLDTEPIGIMGKIFAFVKAFPKTIQKDFLLLLHLPFGAKKGRWIVDNGQKIWKSMTTHSFWETVDVYLPAFLHKQFESHPSTEYVAFCESVLRIIARPEHSVIQVAAIEVERTVDTRAISAPAMGVPRFSLFQQACHPTLEVVHMAIFKIKSAIHYPYPKGYMRSALLVLRN